MVGHTYSQGRRIILNSSITRLVFLETSAKVFDRLLRMDWWVDHVLVVYFDRKKTLDGTRTHIFSTTKAKKALERNFGLISMNVIPIMVEFCLTSGILLFFYGPQYFIIFTSTVCKFNLLPKSCIFVEEERNLVSCWWSFLCSSCHIFCHFAFSGASFEAQILIRFIDSYFNYTKRTAVERKKHIKNQHQYDKTGDFLVSSKKLIFFSNWVKIKKTKIWKNREKSEKIDFFRSTKACRTTLLSRATPPKTSRPASTPQRCIHTSIPSKPVRCISPKWIWVRSILTRLTALLGYF